MNKLKPVTHIAKNNRLKGWDVMKILTNKKGENHEQKTFTKKNPIKQPVVRTNKI